MAKRKTTDAQEKEIRRKIFKEKIDAKKVCEEYGISLTRVRNICGGAIKDLKHGIEHIYV